MFTTSFSLYKTPQDCKNVQQKVPPTTYKILAIQTIIHIAGVHYHMTSGTALFLCISAKLCVDSSSCDRKCRENKFQNGGG